MYKKKFSLTVDFSREEKLALYEYAVEKTGHHPEPEIKIPLVSIYIFQLNYFNSFEFTDLMKQKQVRRQ